MVKKKTDKPLSELTVDYLRKHPDAGIAEIRKGIGRNIPSATASLARKKLGIGKTYGNKAPGKRWSISVESNVPESGILPSGKSNSINTQQSLVLEVLKLSEKSGGIDRLQKAVEFCKRLEDFE